MAYSCTKAEFTVWGFDKAAYGPIELPELVSWIRNGRVSAETWVFVGTGSIWLRAADIPELHLFFHAKPRGLAAADPLQSVRGLDAGALRRIKLLAFMTDEQIERFAGYMEVERVPQQAVIVKQGDRGEAMYLILEGELCVRMSAAGRETILATLGVGDFFGDISLFDNGPRSADVVATASSVLLKITAAAFDELSREAPDLATPFLRAVGKTLTARIRAGNKHCSEAVKFAQAD